MADELGNQGVLLISLAGIAALLANRSVDPPNPPDASRLVLAARLCGATAPYIEAPGIFAWADSKKLYETAVAHVKSSMDDSSWDKAYAEGQSLAIDSAVSLAIDALKE